MIKSINILHVSTNLNTFRIPAWRTYASTDHYAQNNAETLAENIMICSKHMQAMLDATRQCGTKSAILLIS